MSDLKKQLETTETAIKALQDYAENLRSMMEKETPVKWQPVGGEWYVDAEGDVVRSDSSDKFKEFGVERPTAQQAERAAVEMRRFNRLLALRDELCADGLCDEDGTKYFIFFNTEYKKWNSTRYLVSDYVSPCFTTQESAQRACDMLNSGEVEL
jgi:hypothetical protein